MKRSFGIAFLTLFFGCSSSVTYESGVEGSKKISEIDQADATKICAAAEKAAEDFFEENKSGLCKFGGAIGGAITMALGGDGAAACEMAVTDCENNQSEAEKEPCDPTGSSNCDATIAEVEACYNDSLQVTAELFDQFASKSCAELVMDSSVGPGMGMTTDNTPASCKALQMKCPDLDVGLVTTQTSTAS